MPPASSKLRSLQELNVLLPCAALLALCLFGAVYLYPPRHYIKSISFFGFQRWERPFFDLEGVVAGISCWRKGVDIFNSNPCDARGRPGVYSSFWLRLPDLPTGASWVSVYRLAAAIAFIVALAGLPRERKRAGSHVMILALVSPAGVFAVERANVDVLVLAMTMLAVVLLERGFRLRIAAYAIFFTAGLLKYYPFTVLALAACERLPRSTSILVGCGLDFLRAVWLDWDDFFKAVHYNVYDGPSSAKAPPRLKKHTMSTLHPFVDQWT